MKRLYSDGASNVLGCVIKKVTVLLGIGKAKSSRLHPQEDGSSEAKSCQELYSKTGGWFWEKLGRAPPSRCLCYQI